MKKILKPVLFLILISYLVYLRLLVPDVQWLKVKNPKTTSLMRIREAKFRKNKENIRIERIWVPLNKVSENLIHAIVLSEDMSFFSHKGISWLELEIALRGYLQKGNLPLSGSSTITQQLAKNIFLTPEKTILRKIIEMAITYKLEGSLSKNRILELYLNVIEFGKGIFGAQAASRFYFNKSAENLTVSEAVRLVSIIPNPIKYSPFDNTSEFLNELRQKLSVNLYEHNFIDAAVLKNLLLEFNVTNN